jgi:hypothetical protein
MFDIRSKHLKVTACDLRPIRNIPSYLGKTTRSERRPDYGATRMMTETRYLLDRAACEAIRAIGSLSPAAEAVHDRLCLLYTQRALALITIEARG